MVGLLEGWVGWVVGSLGWLGCWMVRYTYEVRGVDEVN